MKKRKRYLNKPFTNKKKNHKSWSQQQNYIPSFQAHRGYNHIDFAAAKSKKWKFSMYFYYGYCLKSFSFAEEDEVKQKPSCHGI